ncbi:hypothetical protein TNCT_558451 [Trichonephila clavata]|uniref:Uncharacterized protein n=1 Tax=Trichonephila clavata TaxID=2740835 RepID=A0A8X6KBK9_TRICU|nr:hypothetical protein TNCT_558451 [Trichonephila clavata]
MDLVLGNVLRAVGVHLEKRKLDFTKRIKPILPASRSALRNSEAGDMEYNGVWLLRCVVLLQVSWELKRISNFPASKFEWKNVVKVFYYFYHRRGTLN